MLSRFYNRTKQILKPSRPTARRLRDVEFEDKENRATSHHPLLALLSAQELNPQQRKYTTKRTKRIVAKSFVSRKLDFSDCYEEYGECECFHPPCKVARLDMTPSPVPNLDEVKTNRAKTENSIPSFLLGCPEANVALGDRDGLHRNRDAADGLFHSAGGKGGAGCRPIPLQGRRHRPSRERSREARATRLTPLRSFASPVQSRARPRQLAFKTGEPSVTTLAQVMMKGLTVTSRKDDDLDRDLSPKGC